MTDPMSELKETLRTHALRLRFGLAFGLPLSWPEFNGRAIQYFRARCRQKAERTQ